MFQVWRDAVSEGNQECMQCAQARPTYTTCPECGGPCTDAPSARYFPGWETDNGELPVLVTGGHSSVSASLQINVTACWNLLPVDHNGVHQAPPDQLLALSMHNNLQPEDVDLYSNIFSAMRQGSYAGMTLADKYKKANKRSN